MTIRQLNILFFMRRNIFKFFCVLLSAHFFLFSDDLCANDPMQNRQLENTFSEIEKYPKSERAKMYFDLSESLELDQSLKGIKCFDQDKNRAFVLDYIRLLKMKSINDQIEILTYSIKEENAKYRGLYCYYLATTKDMASLDYIIELRNGPEKEDVIRALQYYNNPRVIAVLVDMLLNDKSPRIRFIAAGSLGIIGNNIAIPFLQEALNDNECANFPSAEALCDDPVSDSAVRALNKITEKKLLIKEWKKIDFEILQKESKKDAPDIFCPAGGDKEP